MTEKPNLADAATQRVQHAGLAAAAAPRLTVEQEYALLVMRVYPFPPPDHPRGM